MDLSALLIAMIGALGAAALLRRMLTAPRLREPGAPHPLSAKEASVQAYRPTFSWDAAARALGLEYVEPASGGGGRLMIGTSAGLAVTVSEVPCQCLEGCGGSIALAVEIDGRGRIPAQLALRAESRLDAVKKIVAGEDVLLGDGAFDERVVVRGPLDEALAALRHPARQALAPLLTGREATLERGVLRAQLTGTIDQERLLELAAALLAAARALCVDSVLEALEQSALADPSPEVRLRSLRVLLETWREHAAARRAAQAALTDADPRARLAAARLLGDGQSGVVLRQLVDDEAVPTDVRVGAAEALIEQRPDFLREALRGWAADARLAETAARAFGSLGDAEAEPLLIGLLSAPSRSTREAAVTSLGQAGSVRAVEPLTALAAGGALQRQARDAIRRIQSRLGDVGAGRLSVAADPAPGGAVSLPSPEEAEAPAPGPGRVKG